MKLQCLHIENHNINSNKFIYRFTGIWIYILDNFKKNFYYNSFSIHRKGERILQKIIYCELYFKNLKLL